MLHYIMLRFSVQEIRSFASLVNWTDLQRFCNRILIGFMVYTGKVIGYTQSFLFVLYVCSNVSHTFKIRNTFKNNFGEICYSDTVKNVKPLS